MTWGWFMAINPTLHEETVQTRKRMTSLSQLKQDNTSSIVLDHPGKMEPYLDSQHEILWFPLSNVNTIKGQRLSRHVMSILANIYIYMCNLYNIYIYIHLINLNYITSILYIPYDDQVHTHSCLWSHRYDRNISQHHQCRVTKATSFQELNETWSFSAEWDGMG